MTLLRYIVNKIFCYWPRHINHKSSLLCELSFDWSYSWEPYFMIMIICRFGGHLNMYSILF